MALKQNPKKQLSVHQLRTTTIPPQPSLAAIINRSNSGFQAKSSCSASLSTSLNTLQVNKETGTEASLVDDKLARVLALYARWNYDDTEEQGLEGGALQARQQTRCKELRSIIFGFTLHDKQVEAICTLVYKQRDLLLLAKTGFGKSLIFQLVLFLSAKPGVILTLMPLKLL